MTDDGLVTVLQSPDEGLIAVAQSLLDEHGIRYYVKNRHLQSMYGMAQTGLYPYAIQVDRDDAERAQEILSGLAPEGPEDKHAVGEATAPPETQEPASFAVARPGLLSSRTTRYIILFLLLVLPIIFMIIGMVMRPR